MVGKTTLDLYRVSYCQEAKIADQITTEAQLRAHYGKPVEQVYWKDLDYLPEPYQAFIKASPYCLLLTQGDFGPESSPKGDPAGFVEIVSEKVLHLPDRPGNKRLDSLLNILKHPQVGLFFMVPHVGETLRVQGDAVIRIDEDLCHQYSVQGKPARSVLEVKVTRAFYQCKKAAVRSNLWNYPTTEERTVPTAGELAQAVAGLRGEFIDGKAYDEAYPQRMKETIY